ncbi:Ig-like domain-containing protein, partial [Caballeronia sp. dw_19]|uniref:Ig-like domain-containing protein n=1 Tax=Caballeronia sp. dw_19 TaxID=2719791 RepID=UPI002105C89A
TETNPAGTSSATSAATAVVVDTTTPAKLSTPVLTDDSNASIPAGSATTDGHPHISGTGTAGDTVKIYDGSTLIGSTKVDGTGKWSFTPSTDVSIGTHSITATQTNAAGTTGAKSDAVAFTFAPAPVITNVVDAVGPVQGTVPNNGTTDDNLPTVGGTGTVGDTVYLFMDGIGAGQTTVDATGHWALKPQWTINDGSHTFIATQFASGQAQSAASNSWTITVNTTTPATPAAPTLTDDANASIPAGSTTTDGHPHISGTGTAGDIITVYDGTAVLGTATVDTNGKWTFTPATDLATGTHSINVTETNAAGTASAHSANTAFTFSVTPIETTSITGMYDDTSGSQVLIPVGGTTWDSTPIVKGTVSAALGTGEVLEVYRDGVAVGTAIVSGTSWSFNDSGVAGGTHAYTARVQNGSLHGLVSNSYSIVEAIVGNVGQVMGVNNASGGGCTFYIMIGNLDPQKISLTMPTGTGSIGNGALTLATGLTLIAPGVMAYQVANNLAWWATRFFGNTSATGWEYWPNGITGGAGGSFMDMHTLASYSVSPGVWMNVTGPMPAGVSATHQVNLTDDSVTLAQVSSVAESEPATVTQPHHTAVGEHDAFIGTTGNDTVDLNADPTSYFKESTAHIQGSTAHPTEPAGTMPSANTLHLTGDHQVLDLTSLTGQTAAAKISGIEVIDLGGHANNLKLSLTDVLNLGEQDLFQKDGHQQLMVKGSNGDTVDLSNTHIAGVADGQWQAEGTAVVGGVTYNVYEHSGAHTELLVQQGVQIALHN